MDKVFQRFLTKIGFTELSPFENGYFDKLVNEKEYQRLQMRIKLPEYLDYDLYVQFFDKADNFTRVSGVSLNIEFLYDDEKKNIEKLIKKYIEAKGADKLNDNEIYRDDYKILFYYANASEALDIKNQATALSDFLSSISSKYKLFTQEKVYFDNDFAQRRDEEYRNRTIKATERTLRFSIPRLSDKGLRSVQKSNSYR